MYFAVCILKEEEILEKLLQKLVECNIHNVTVLHSDYYAKETKMNKRNVNIFSSMRYIMGYYADESRVLMIPVEESQKDLLLEIIEDFLPRHQYLFFLLPVTQFMGELE